MKPILFLFEDPQAIAAKVAAQMGISPEEATQHMEMWDKMSIGLFQIGNDFPRKELH